LKSGHDTIKQLKTVKLFSSCVPVFSLFFTLIFAAELKAVAVDQTGSDLSSAMVWTGKPTLDKAPENMVAFRKQFEMTTLPQHATLHLFADVRYMLWVNGRHVERGPARFEPAAPEYDSVDITKFMCAGSNLISILVTAQISNGRTRLHEPCLTAELVEQNDGESKIIFNTDATWKWSDQTRYRRAITDWANIYDVVDARVEDGDWTQLDYDDSKWATVEPVKDKTWGTLTARRIPLLRETVVVPEWQAGLQWPVMLKTNEQITFKFPHLVLAYVQIDMDADQGSVVELTYSPKTKITCRAGKQTYISTDTHSIFEGGIRVKSGRVTLQSVKFVERLYPFDQIGTFESSNPLLNQLWKTCVRGLEITSEDAYMDCADRERVEWMDCDPPAFDATRVAMAGSTADGKEIFADPRLLEEMLRRTAYTLQPGGWVKAHTSSDRFDIHAKMEDRACDWVEGARRYYESCGQTEVIREIWPAIVKQMNYFLDRRTARGLVLAREWVVWGNPVGYQTCEGTALNAFVCKALVDAAFLGNLIGEKKQAKIFDRAAKDLADAINGVLWDKTAGTYYAGYYDLAAAKKAPDYRPLKLKVENNLIEPTRHAALFTLDQGVVPKNLQASVTKYLMANPPTENDIMQYYYFFKQQYAADEPAQDLAVLNKQRAEWKDMAESPYEATFEGLHSWGSQAHCYGMFPAYFLSSYVLGVRLDGPVQKKSLLIEPRLGDLTEASGTVVTEFGPVPVSWEKVGEHWNFSAEVPAGIKTRLRLPVGTGKFIATLDGKNITSKQKGRWLEIPLKGGMHSGTWNNTN
jgi:alpha-L-rhamnosidase